jgi:hypothetical protein
VYVQTVTFTKTEGVGADAATAVLKLRSIGPFCLGMELRINGEVTDEDMAEFNTEAERDKALAGCIAAYDTNGYART